MATNGSEEGETGGKFWKRVKSFFSSNNNLQNPQDLQDPHSDTGTGIQSDSHTTSGLETGTEISQLAIEKMALIGGHLYYTLNPSKLRNPKVGKGIIIVNESFDEHKELLREGAEKDKENFEAIFDKLGICYEGRSHKNLTTGEMWKNLEKFANSEVLEDSVLFVAISTHSEHMGEITGTDNVPISLSHIYNFFYKNTELLNIPKVFLIEASKATESKVEADYHPPSVRLEKFKSQDFPSATVISDTLIVHSSLDSRDKEDGSSFIKELRDCIHNPEYESMHLADIITICTNTVITNCSKSEEDCSITIQSTLRKKLRF